MTGDQALQIVELAILRVRDRAMAQFPRNEDLLTALGSIAGEIADMHSNYCEAKRAVEQSPRVEG